jgi:peptidoglycan/xylan/chitin deacetylase (PgdA/CDA1 family)
MSTRAELAASVLGSPLVERAAIAATRRHLRVLAYHGCENPERFANQVDHLVEHFVPVTGARVAEAVHGGERLPDRAVWLTFDDAIVNVVDHARPILAARGVPATMFVCPGLVDHDRAFWWQTVEAAVDREPIELDGRRWTDRSLVTHLKTIPDNKRRSAVRAMSYDTEPDLGSRRPVGAGDLDRWCASGNEVGNHTWDHPCLNRCSPDAQREQIARAHDALTTVLGEPPSLFAYPNGDFTPTAEAALIKRGYQVGLLFDHRLCQRDPNPLRMSRLRIDADAGLDRFRAVVGGVHSGAFRVAAMARRRSEADVG